MYKKLVWNSTQSCNCPLNVKNCMLSFDSRTKLGTKIYLAIQRYLKEFHINHTSSLNFRVFFNFSKKIVKVHENYFRASKSTVIFSYNDRELLYWPLWDSKVVTIRYWMVRNFLAFIYKNYNKSQKTIQCIGFESPFSWMN